MLQEEVEQSQEEANQSQEEVDLLREGNMNCYTRAKLMPKRVEVLQGAILHSLGEIENE